MEDTVASGNIAGDGSLVLKLYYTRNSYGVTYAYTVSYTHLDVYKRQGLYNRRAAEAHVDEALLKNGGGMLLVLDLSLIHI